MVYARCYRFVKQVIMLRSPIWPTADIVYDGGMTEVLDRPLAMVESVEETPAVLNDSAPAADFAGMLPLLPVDTHVAPEATHRAQLSREKADKQAGLWRRLGNVALAGSVIAGSATMAFHIDQQNLAPAVWGDSQAVVHTLYSSPQLPVQPGTDVVVIPGTGIKDATPNITEPLEPSFRTIPNVTVLSLEEGVHPQIDTTLKVIDRAIETNNPPERVVLYGMSAGGKEALQIAAHLRESLPDTDLVVILSSSPFNKESAFQLQGQYNTDPWLAQVSSRLNVHGGPMLRLGVELYNHRHDYDTNGQFDIGRAIRVGQAIAHNKLSRQATSNDLYIWQAMLTINNTVEGDLSQLANVPGGPRTSLLYIQATFDEIVDENQAIPAYAELAAKYHIPFTVARLNDPHASEYAYADNYNDIVLIPYFRALEQQPYNLADLAIGSAPPPDLAAASPASPTTPASPRPTG